MLASVIVLLAVGVSFAQISNNPYVPCGVQTVQPHAKRIVGGSPATPGSWPWTVLIADARNTLVGSGAIIDQYVILTSAQHFEGSTFSSFDLNLRYWRVFAGEYNISSTDPNEKFYHIRRVVVHPGFNATSLENDVALAILTDYVRWNAHTRPLCLPDGYHNVQTGQTCYVPGWGSTSSTGDEQVMNQLAYPILDDSACQKHWVDYLPNTEICAGYENSTKDFCADDIGSPLTCKSPTGAWYVQGLASSGGDCKTASTPGVFEDVSQYADWIKRTMEEAGYMYQY